MEEKSRIKLRIPVSGYGWERGGGGGKQKSYKKNCKGQFLNFLISLKDKQTATLHPRQIQDSFFESCITIGAFARSFIVMVMISQFKHMCVFSPLCTRLRMFRVDKVWYHYSQSEHLNGLSSLRTVLRRIILLLALKNLSTDHTVFNALAST